MDTVKQQLDALLQQLPGDCAGEEIQYQQYILETIRQGIEAADGNQSLTQEEVEARFAQWLTE